MNTLEEVVFPRKLSANEKQIIDTQLSQLIEPISQLKQQSALVAQDAQQNARSEQFSILKDIVDYNHNLIAQNNDQIYKVIQQERLLADSLLQKNQTDIDPKKAHNTAVILETNKKLDHFRLEYINTLEGINFTEIAKIRKVDKTCVGSFNKIWIWILEVFYSVPSSKYDWEDFSRKSMSKKHDSGNELRRKMIIYDVRSMSVFQAKELEGITNSDIPLLKDKMNPSEELKKFFDALNLLYEMYRMSMLKSKQKEESKLTYDVRIQEEERNAINASKRLNTIKFDIMSEVQNLYVLIDSEFK